MSILKPGTVCMLVVGCPGNLGQLVEVVTHIGPFREFDDVYVIRTASGRPFKEVVQGWRVVPGTSAVQYAQRSQLKPLRDHPINMSDANPAQASCSV